MTTRTSSTTRRPSATADEGGVPARIGRLRRALGGSRRRLLVAGIAGGVVFATVGLLLGRLLADEQPAELVGPAGAPFRVELVEGWVTTPEEELRALPGAPLGIARNEEGRGLLLVRLEERAPPDFEAFTKRLDRELDRRFPDFERRGARRLRVLAGPAYSYSYIRRRRGTVHSIVIVPAGGRSYAVNTVARGGADDVARDLDRMISSFDV
jgi:hypothetical protein